MKYSKARKGKGKESKRERERESDMPQIRKSPKESCPGNEDYCTA